VREVLHPIDTDRFRPGPGPAEPGYLLLTARIRDPRKNVELLLRASARIRDEHPSIRLVIAGDEPTPSTRALVSRLGLEASTTFAGYVDGDRLTTLYQGASLFVVPSRQEGLCISVQEAMACGLPVVSTRCGGPESLIEDGVTGRLVANDDVAALSAAVSALLREPAQRGAMGLAGRARSVQLWSTPSIRTQLRTAFADVFGASVR
jgi:glycosyltransferase involved in cell wall biosynthesis